MEREKFSVRHKRRTATSSSATCYSDAVYDLIPPPTKTQGTDFRYEHLASLITAEYLLFGVWHHNTVSSVAPVGRVAL